MPTTCFEGKRKKLLIKNRYQEIRNYLLISVLEREQRTKKQLENRIERKQDENEETTSKYEETTRRRNSESRVKDTTNS